MANPIKYSTGAETLALKSGNFYIGTGDVAKGPTVSTGYWNGSTPPDGGYVVYVNKATQGPSTYFCNNDSELITITNKIAGQSYTSATQCLVYYLGQTDKLCANIDYPPIITSGLVLNLDAGFVTSYPKSGTTWSDLTSSAQNGTLVNGPSFNSDKNGNIVFDGTNDYVSLPSNSVNTNSSFTIEFWTKRTSGDGTLLSGINATGHLQVRMTGSYVSLVKSYIAELGNFGANSATNLNSIYQIVITRTGTSYKCYINGFLRGSLIINQTYTTSNPTLGINYTISEGFSGSIYKFSTYNRELSSSEILQNFNAAKSRFYPSIVTNNLVLNFDAGNAQSYPQSGTTWYDLTSNGYNGTLTNGPTFSSQNQGSIVFDATNDYVQTSSVNLFSNSIYAESWIYPTSIGADFTSRTIFYKDLEFLIRTIDYLGTKFLFAYVYINSTYVDLYTGSIGIQINKWTHIGFGWDYNTPSNNYKVYINGSLVAQQTTTASIPTASSPFIVGSFSGSSEFFNGNISIVRVYNQFLTDSEVLQNYEAIVPRY
jgi:hypothetical protein